VRTILSLLTGLCIVATCSASEYVFSVKDAKLYLNGEEFKIIGLRCSNALVSDTTTQELIDSLDTYKSYGVNMVGVYFMGSRFGDVKGYRPDASLDPDHASRMARIIKAADERGMVVLVGCLYWSTSRAKEDLGRWKQADANRAVANTVRWLRDNDYRNVFVDPDNEGMAVRAKHWRVESLIAAAHEVDPSMMVANNTRQKAGNSDLNIHHGPKEPHKPWLNTEATPGDTPGGYWGRFSKETHQVNEDYHNYSRIGRYTMEMKRSQLADTIRDMESHNGYGFASTWIQCGPAEGVGGPFTRLGGRSNLGANDNERAAWNRDIDTIHPDAGILWWMEFMRDRYGPWRPPAARVRRRNVGRYMEQDGELTIEAEGYGEHALSKYARYDQPHRWVHSTEMPGYSGRGYLQVLPDEWPEGGSGPSSPRDASGARLAYPIRTNTAGKYRVYVRGLSMGGESNGVHVGVDGVLAGKGTGASNMSGFRPHHTWVWENGRKDGYEQPATLHLSRGDHLLHVWNRDDGFCLDKIVLRRQEDRPTGRGPEQGPQTGALQ
jgi:hypothetical protein